MHFSERGIHKEFIKKTVFFQKQMNNKLCRPILYGYILHGHFVQMIIVLKFQRDQSAKELKLFHRNHYLYRQMMTKTATP